MKHRIVLFILCTSVAGLVCSAGGHVLDPHSAGAPAAPVYIRLNQVGYIPTESKLALAMTNETLSGQTFNAITVQGRSPVLTGSVGIDRGTYGGFAHLYELDFAGLTASGKYRLQVGSEPSPTFTIGTSVYANVISPTLQFFRVQRCGDTAPAMHSVCHLNDGIASGGPANGTAVDATGGWHDAGDYLKFAITTGASTNLMLTAYQHHPAAFADADHNGVPDVLDEARVGLDWMLKLWDPTNGVLYYQVGDESDHDTWRMPEGDDANRPTRPVWACEPGKGANVAGKTAAALALAASLWNDPARSFYSPTLASTYRTVAQQIYDYGKARPAAQSATSGFYDETSWQDDMALAAAELYRATGDTTYLNEAHDQAAAAGNAWTFDYDNMHGLAHYEIARLDSTYVPSATAWLAADLSAMQTAASTNPFRAAVDQFYWGSAASMMGAALEALWYEDLSGQVTYHALAQAQRDYVLGGNPWGVCWVNSLGVTWPHHPHHQVADLTDSELVGFWDEGPMPRADWRALGITLSAPDTYAAFQSAAAVYHDDVADYATNEPTLVANALGLALATWYAPIATPVMTDYVYLPFVLNNRASLHSPNVQAAPARPDAIYAASDPMLPRDFALPTPLFAPGSAWNQKITTVDVLSTSDEQILVTYRVLRGDTTSLHPPGPPSTTWPFPDVNYDHYTIPVFRAGTAQRSVLICDYEGNQWWPSPKFPDAPQQAGGPVTIPAPASTVRPAGPTGIDSDGHLVLYDDTTFVEYDFWQATTVRDGECQSQGGGLTGDTIFEAGAIDFFDVRAAGTNSDTLSSARATGVPLLAGLILPEDVESGAIPHALAVAIPGLRNLSADPYEPLPSDYFYPVSTTETDYYNTDPDALAAGQRLRLKQTIVDDAGYPINESQLAPITQMFLTALRTYGAYMVDNAGGFSFYAEDIHTAVLDLTGEQVNALIGESAGTPLPADKTKWQIVIETLNLELEQIPFAYGPWTDGQDPSEATITSANFEVVEPATETATYSLSVTPSSRTIAPGGVATYTIRLETSDYFSTPVSLVATSPSPSLTLQLAPTEVIPPGQATLTATDHHQGTGLPPGLRYDIPITATDGVVQTTGVGLLISGGGIKIYLPVVLADSHMTPRSLSQLTTPPPDY